jgi:hypothetical protein
MLLLVGLLCIWRPVTVSARVIPESGGIPTAFPNNADEDRILVSSLRGRRAVTNMSEYLWKDGIIPYRFSESVKEGRHCMHFQVVVRLPTAVKIDLGLRFICPTI